MLVGPPAGSQEHTPGTPSSSSSSWSAVILAGTAEDKVWDAPPGAQCDVLSSKCPSSTQNGSDRV